MISSSGSAPKSLQAVRSFTDEMLSWVQSRGRIVIIVHDNPDPDCLASAMALRQLFLARLGRDSVITFSGMIGRSENLALAKAMKLTLVPLDIVDISPDDVVCMLDTQPGTGNNSLPKGLPVHVLVDHHPLRESSRECRWIDVRDNYGATATILYQYLIAQNLSVSSKLATALFYAIKSETQDLGREANLPDREAYLALFPLASKRLLYEITHPRLPIEYFRTISITLQKSIRYGNCLITAGLGDVAFPEIVAEMADFLLQLENIEAVFTMGRYNNELILSLRTTRHDLNAGEIIRGMVAGIGTAGGHGMMAGGKVGAAFSDFSEIEVLLENRFLTVFGFESEDGVRLLEDPR